MARKAIGPRRRPVASNELPHTIGAIVDFSASPQATPLLAAGFGLMVAHEGGLSPGEFLRYPGVSTWRDEVLDRLAGFEGEPNAVFGDLMIDAICELGPVEAGLTCGYFFAEMTADSPEVAAIFQSAVLRGVETALGTGK